MNSVLVVLLVGAILFTVWVAWAIMNLRTNRSTLRDLGKEVVAWSIDDVRCPQCSHPFGSSLAEAFGGVRAVETLARIRKEPARAIAITCTLCTARYHIVYRQAHFGYHVVYRSGVADASE